MEPQIKEEFHNAMEEFYQKINDPAFKGACFMAVCRGKVKFQQVIERFFIDMMEIFQNMYIKYLRP